MMDTDFEQQMREGSRVIPKTDLRIPMPPGVQPPAQSCESGDDVNVETTPLRRQSAVDFSIETTSLHFIPQKIGFSLIDPPAAIKGARYAQHPDLTYRSLLHTLTAYVLKSEHIKQRVHHFKLPLNWWEHLKETHAPEWFKKRYPVQYEKRPFHYTEHTHLCPHADVPWPEDAHLEFMTQKPLRKATSSDYRT